MIRSSIRPSLKPPYELKKLSNEGIAAAEEKAERYRLLNEPVQAESICLDILAVSPEDQKALVILFLALTDQLESRLLSAYDEARALLPRLKGEYERIYYEGILCERRGGAHHARGGTAAGEIAGEWYRRAMMLYERAQTLHSVGNDDPVIRWNTCARILMRHPEMNERDEDPHEPFTE